MMIGFVIWSIICLLVAGVGVWTWRSKEAAGFFTGVKPPEVTDVRKYNRAVAMLWFVYAALFELLGLPFLFLKQNSLGFMWVFAVVPLTIGLAIAYHRILEKYRKK